MGSDYFKQAKNYAPDIRDMIEPNLIFEDNPSRHRNVMLSHTSAEDWRKTNDIQSLVRASEGLTSYLKFSLLIIFLIIYFLLFVILFFYHFLFSH